jgi:hypothetical protein
MIIMCNLFLCFDITYRNIYVGKVLLHMVLRNVYEIMYTPYANTVTPFLRDALYT